MNDIGTVALTVVTGTVGAYLGALWGSRQGARRTIYEKIHENRMRLYKEVWKKTGLLPRRPRTIVVTHGSVAQLGIDLQQWYYEEGGMYLSGGARRAYSAAQDAIESVRLRGEADSDLSKADYELVRSKCSDLRIALTRDLLSRSRPPTGHKWHPNPT